MASPAAISVALYTLLEAGMIRPFQKEEAADKARAWAALLTPSMSDKLLGEAVQLVASGRFQVFGACKPADVNKAAAMIRSRRIEEWRRQHGEPQGPSDPALWLPYIKGFTAAIGNGCDTQSADQHGRAAIAMVRSMIGSGSSARQAIAEIESHLQEGRIPWKTTPPPRPVAEILPPEESPMPTASRLAAFAQASSRLGKGYR